MGSSHIENISTVVMHRWDMEWSGQFENGSWKGMIGNLERGDGDIIASSLTLTPGKYHVTILLFETTKTSQHFN